jgi:hypothetical protein
VNGGSIGFVFRLGSAGGRAWGHEEGGAGCR